MPHASHRPGERVVDLNADLGEEVTDDAGLLAVVTSANVACGYHAGTAETMRQVCAAAAEQGVALGAHVSYADREHFGRRPRDVEPEVLREQVADQLGTLRRHAVEAGVEVGYLKAHGALYHRILDDPEQAAAVLAGSDDLPLLSMAGVCRDLAGAEGRTTYDEGFPDRGYRAGRLLARTAPGALLDQTSSITAQALHLAGGVDSLCLHGDSPGALERAVAVAAALRGAGWRLDAFTSRAGAG